MRGPLLKRERKPGLLAGLPRLDAKESGDAWVAGHTQEALIRSLGDAKTG